jgi:hypothetical protein
VKQPMPETRKAPSVAVSYEPRHLDLPDLPSELLSMALQDLCIVEQSDKSHYVIDMHKWHVPNADKTMCSVCLAGAVLTRFLDEDEYCQHPDGIFDAETCRKLGAIDLFRMGSLRSGVRFMGLTVPPGLHDMEIPAYDEDPSAFRTCIALSAQELKRVGF